MTLPQCVDWNPPIPTKPDTHVFWCRPVRSGAMFSVCTLHQSKQNGFHSLLSPLSVLSPPPPPPSVPATIFNGVCARKEMTMPPIM